MQAVSGRQKCADPSALSFEVRSDADRLERAFAERRVDRGAGALGNELPGIALVIGRGGCGAGGARAGGAVVPALQRNARLGSGGRGHARKRRGKRAGKDKGDSGVLVRHRGYSVLEAVDSASRP